jgi:hypothetical protein
MLGISDLWTIGDTSNPWIVNSYFQYRDNPLRTSPSHPDSGIPNTLFNLFDTYTSGDEFGNLGQASFGPGYNAFTYYQKYYSAGINIGSQFGRHNVKFGWDYQNSKVDGAEPNNFFTQLFATIDDFNTYVQDDWKVTSKITINAGLRWDYDSQFPNKTDFSPWSGRRSQEHE